MDTLIPLSGERACPCSNPYPETLEAFFIKHGDA